MQPSRFSTSRTCHHPRLQPCACYIITPHLPSSQPLVTITWLSVSIHFTILATSCKWNHITIIFCVWFISFSIVHSRFIHDIECIRMLSLFQAESYSTVCICEIMANSHVVLRSNTEILYNFHPISPKGNILHHFSTISQISENYYQYNPFTLFLFHHLNLILCEYVCESELYLVLCNFTTRIGWCDQHEFQHKELSCYIFIATAATQALFTNPWQPLISPPCL